MTTTFNLFAAFGVTNQDRVDVYYKIFRRLDPAIYRDVCKRLVLTSRQLPTVSEIASEYTRAECGEITDPEAVAQAEANRVLRLVRENGANREPQFWDPATREIMRTRFNWRSLCATLRDDQTQWFVRDFVAAYLNARKVCRFGEIESEKIKALFDKHGIKQIKAIT